MLLKMEVSKKKKKTVKEKILTAIWGDSQYLRDYFLPLTVCATGLLPDRQFILNLFLQEFPVLEAVKLTYIYPSL